MNKPERGKVIPMHNIRHVGHSYSFGEMKLEVGKHYWFGTKYVRFIQVTQKGFNFLDEEKSRCLLRKHLYAKGFTGIPLPQGQKEFVFKINALHIYKIAEVV